MPLGQPSSLGQPRRRQPGGGSSSGGPSGSCGGGIKHITPATLQQREGHGQEWVGGTPEGNPWWAGRLGPQRTFDPPPPRSGGPSGNGSGNEGLLEKDEAASNEDESDVEETSACCPDCGYEDWLMFQACPACSPDEAFKASPGRDRSRTPRRHRQPRPRRNPKLRRQERLLPNAWLTQLFNLAKAAGNDSIEVALYEDADEAAAEDDEDGAGIAEEAAEDAEEAAEDEDADEPMRRHRGGGIAEVASRRRRGGGRGGRGGHRPRASQCPGRGLSTASVRRRRRCCCVPYQSQRRRRRRCCCAATRARIRTEWAGRQKHRGLVAICCACAAASLIDPPCRRRTGQGLLPVGRPALTALRRAGRTGFLAQPILADPG